MAAEEIMKLFEIYWFEKPIFIKHKPQEPNPPVQEIVEEDHAKEEESSEKPENLQEQSLPSLTLHVSRSLSDQNLMSSKTSLFGSSGDIFSPNSVLNVATGPKLRTVVSGKEVNDFLSDQESVKQEGDTVAKDIEKERHDVRKGRMKKKGFGSSKSLTDLEYEELKGFMDLGFVFSEEDVQKDSSLASIIPGLQRLQRKDDDVEEETKKRKDGVSRPYLSEAWGVWREKKAEKPILMKWRVPAPVSEVDMKDHLRQWAHTVASTVR